MIVCLGMDSTDSAFLRWVYVVFEGRDGNTGEEGRDAESLGEFWPTVVAAEKEVSDGSLSTSYVWVVFNGPSCCAYSRRRLSPIPPEPFNPFFVGTRDDPSFRWEK